MDIIEVGTLTTPFFFAEMQRIRAQEKARNLRREHPCQGVIGHEGPCHYYSDESSWCDNCKIVEPAWKDYRKATLEMQRFRRALTRKMRRVVRQELPL